MASNMMRFQIMIGDRSRIEGNAEITNHGELRAYLNNPDDEQWLRKLVEIGQFKNARLTFEVVPARPRLADDLIEHVAEAESASPYDGTMKVGEVIISRRRYSYLRSLMLDDDMIERITKFIPPEEMKMESPADFKHARQLTARSRVMDYYTSKGWVHADGSAVTLENVYVIQFTYIMGNWKAWIETDCDDATLFEVSHNGLGNETYLEVFKKSDSQTFIDVED